MSYIKYLWISLFLTVLFIVFQNFEFDTLPTGTLLHALTFNETLNLWKDDKLLDLKGFNYIINNRLICENDKTHIVQIVTSFAANVETRSALRRAYPQEELEKLGIVRVFLLGKLKQYQTDVSQMALINENDRYGDLLQGNFYESYRNLTYKHIMGLKWAVMYCTAKKYIIKMDDDILVNMYELVNIIKDNFQTSIDLMGYLLKGMRPIRIKANKWYVTKEEYSGDQYPSFLSGWLYVTTPQSAMGLVFMAHQIPYFWIDDLFITGIIANELENKFVDISKYFTTHPELIECCIRHGVKCEFVVAPTGGDNMLQVRFQEHSKKCYYTDCQELPEEKRIEKTCVAKRKYGMPLQKGIPFYTKVQI